MNRLMLAARTAMANTAVTVVDMEGELDITTAIDFDSFLKDLINQKRHKLKTRPPDQPPLY